MKLVPAASPALALVLALGSASCVFAVETGPGGRPVERTTTHTFDASRLHLADLRVRPSLRIQQNAITQGIEIWPSIANDGDADAVPFDVTAVLERPGGSDVVVTNRWPALAAGDSLRAVVNPGPIPAVRYARITVIADPVPPSNPNSVGAVFERDESNNARVFTTDDFGADLDAILNGG